MNFVISVRLRILVYVIIGHVFPMSLKYRRSSIGIELIG